MFPDNQCLIRSSCKQIQIIQNDIRITFWYNADESDTKKRPGILSDRAAQNRSCSFQAISEDSLLTDVLRAVFYFARILFLFVALRDVFLIVAFFFAVFFLAAVLRLALVRFFF